jgi:hypothetical protein
MSTDTEQHTEQHNGQAPAAPRLTDPRTPIAWHQRPDESNPWKLDEMGIRLPFGDLPNQTALPSVVAEMLTYLMRTHREVFSDALVYASTGEAPEHPTTPKRGRPKGAAE